MGLASELPGVEVDTSTLTRALYSSDASLYRVVPRGVCHPASVSDLALAVRTALRAGVPITIRGAGTSCAGNAVGPGLVVDTSRYLNRILALDPGSRLARVEPGVVQGALQAAARPHGLRFGPDPSTGDRCTIGGMIGNNACGPRALGFGRTSDNVTALEVVTGTGERLDLDRRADLRRSDSPTLMALWRLVQQNLGVIRTEFGRFSRQVSGYSLEHLLPERGFDVTRFLVGSEGTLAVVLRAEIQLLRIPATSLTLVLGFPSMAEAADAMPRVLPFSPTACEGLDQRIVAAVAQRRLRVPTLPGGGAWLFLELAGDDRSELVKRAQELIAAARCHDSRVVANDQEAAALWRLRSDGAGLAAVALERPAHAGWEDAAVPADKLGDYLRAFDVLLAEHGLHALPYGHFGEGCVHCRIDFPLGAPDGAVRLKAFVEEAADLVAGFGGSLSGEHGDGRARSGLLPRMYSQAALALFAKVKQIFDPQGLLNPGVLVDPAPVEASLRLADNPSPLMVSHPAFAAAAHRCTGVGKCLAGDNTVMCPSFRATGQEKDSTRGRARVLQEMLDGRLIAPDWRAPEVQQALQLCLACKACARECPTGTDLAQLKSVVLAEKYRARLRPRLHYVLGWLPVWGRLVIAVPGLPALLNSLLARPFTRRIATRAAGINPQRGLPRFARRQLSRASRGGRPVAVWVDSSSAIFDGGGLTALLDLLAESGYAPTIIERTACCGLPWTSTGQRDQAAKQVRRSLEVLFPIAKAGVPIVGLEPSCVAALRSDAADLVDDPRVQSVAEALHTLAELLTADPGWRPPDLSGLTVVVQPHCHHRAVVGWEPDAALLAATGATVVTVDGCCGLAGSFGLEAGNDAISRAVAELELLPAIRQAGAAAILVADGISCRTQIADLTGRPSLTLAELLIRGR